MVKTKRNKKTEEVKELKLITAPETVEEVKETVVEPVVETKSETKKAAGKDYVVVLGTPSFYVVRLEDGTMKTIQGSNTYRRGDIVRL